jgi:hypothetical protein
MKKDIYSLENGRLKLSIQVPCLSPLETTGVLNRKENEGKRFFRERLNFIEVAQKLNDSIERRELDEETEMDRFWQLIGSRLLGRKRDLSHSSVH